MMNQIVAAQCCQMQISRTSLPFRGGAGFFLLGTAISSSESSLSLVSGLCFSEAFIGMALETAESGTGKKQGDNVFISRQKWHFSLIAIEQLIEQIYNCKAQKCSIDE